MKKCHPIYCWIMSLCWFVLWPSITIASNHFTALSVSIEGESILLTGFGSPYAYSHAFLFNHPIDTSYPTPLAGGAEDVVVTNDYAYVASGKHGINRVNVQSPYDVKKNIKTYFQNNAYFHKLFIYQSYLFASMYYQKKIAIFYIDKNFDLVLLNYINLSNYVHHIVVNLDILYTVSRDGIIEPFQLSEFSHQSMTYKQLPPIPTGFQLIQNVFVNNNNQVVVVNATNQMVVIQDNTICAIKPDYQFKTPLGHAAYDIIFNEAHPFGQLALLDIQSPNKTPLIYVFPFSSVRRFTQKNGYIYIANGRNGLIILDDFKEANVVTNNKSMSIFRFSNISKQSYGLLLNNRDSSCTLNHILFNKHIDINRTLLNQMLLEIVVEDNIQLDDIIKISQNNQSTSCINVTRSPHVNQFNSHGTRLHSNTYSCFDINFDTNKDLHIPINPNTYISSKAFPLKPLEMKSSYRMEYLPSEITQGPFIEITYTLYPDQWNMISMPILLEPDSIKKFMSYISVLYSFESNSYSYLLNQTIEPGKGYWAKVKENDQGTIEPIIITLAGSDFISYTRKLSIGWHLLGGINAEHTKITINFDNNEHQENVLNDIFQYLLHEKCYERVEFNRIISRNAFWINVKTPINIKVSKEFETQ